MSLRSTAGTDIYRASEKYMFVADHAEWAVPGTFPACIYSTGYTGNPHFVLRSTIMDRDGVRKVLQTHSVLSVDSGGTATFANDTAIAAINDAVAWSEAQGRVGPFLLVGTSMGFMDLAAWARTHQSKVTGLIGFTPGVNLTAAHAENRQGLAAAINTAYGGAYVPATHAAAHNPITYAGSLTFPIMVLGSSNDTLVTPADLAAFDAASPTCQYIAMGAVGDHNQAAVTAAAARAELTAFIASL